MRQLKNRTTRPHALKCSRRNRSLESIPLGAFHAYKSAIIVLLDFGVGCCPFSWERVLLLLWLLTLTCKKRREKKQIWGSAGEWVGIKSVNPTGSSQPTNKSVKHDPANQSTGRPVGLFRTFPVRTYVTWSSDRLFPF